MSALTLVAFLLRKRPRAWRPARRFVRHRDLPGREGRRGDRHLAGRCRLIENGVSRDITSLKPDRGPLSVAIILDSSPPSPSLPPHLWTPSWASFHACRRGHATRSGRPATARRDRGPHRRPARRGRGPAPRGPPGWQHPARRLRRGLGRPHGRPRGRPHPAGGGDREGPELSSRDKHRAAEEAEKNADRLLAVEIDAGDADFEIRANLSYVFDRLARGTGGRHAASCPRWAWTAPSEALGAPAPATASPTPRRPTTKSASSHDVARPGTHAGSATPRRATPNPGAPPRNTMLEEARLRSPLGPRRAFAPAPRRPRDGRSPRFSGPGSRSST